MYVDLSSLYTWNLKQLYVYIEVTWVNEDGISNRMIASDWIIQSPADRTKIGEKYYIQSNNKQIQYNVRDVHRKLRGKTVNVTLNAQYMPTVGFFSKVLMLLGRPNYTPPRLNFPTNTYDQYMDLILYYLLKTNIINSSIGIFLVSS